VKLRANTIRVGRAALGRSSAGRSCRGGAEDGTAEGLGGASLRSTAEGQRKDPCAAAEGHGGGPREGGDRGHGGEREREKTQRWTGK
jgi:hypothetical protein